MQNEPHELPEDIRQHWETMFWTPEETRDFVRDHLGPALHCEKQVKGLEEVCAAHAAYLRDLKIMAASRGRGRRAGADPVRSVACRGAGPGRGASL